MQIHIFRGTGRIFAFTARSRGDNLPGRYAPWTLFRTMAVLRGRAERGFDVDNGLDDIERHGIHVTDAHVRITEQALA